MYIFNTAYGSYLLEHRFMNNCSMLKHLKSYPSNVACAWHVRAAFQKAVFSVKYDKNPTKTGKDAEGCELRGLVPFRIPTSAITS